MKTLIACVCAIAFVALAACESSREGVQLGCLDGTSIPCTCTDGRSGAQVCSGNSVGPCECTGTQDVGGGGQPDAGFVDLGAPDDGADPEIAVPQCSADECTDGTYCSGGMCIEPQGCSTDLVGWRPLARGAYWDPTADGKVLVYASGTGDGDPPFEKLFVRFAEGAVQPGTIDLANEDPNDCDVCVRAYSYCNEDACFNRFVATSGQLDLQAVGADGTLVGQIRELTLTEVYLDPATGRYTGHPNPKTFCVGDHAFDVRVPELRAASPGCLPEGDGDGLGAHIGDFALTNCLGEQVNLHSLCGTAELVWITAVAGWNGAAEKFASVIADVAQDLSGSGLRAWVVIGETGSGTAPDLAYCAAYAQDHGLDPTRVFVDTGLGAKSVLAGAFEQHDASVPIPWSALLDGDNMRFLWSSVLSEGGVLSEVSAQLPQTP